MSQNLPNQRTKYRPMACGFHAHSDMSLDGGVTIEQKVARAVELGRPADCLTDHGNMNGLAMLHQCCAKKKIMSIMGIEAYVIDPYEPTKVVMRRGTETTVPNFAHMTIHFKTQDAYQYFCRLTPIMESRAVTIFGERKPLMNWEELEGIAGQIVIGSGCLVSFIQKHVLNGRIDRATHMYEKIRSLAGPENFYVEIFGHEVTHNWKSPGKDTAGNWMPKMFVPNECDAAGLIKDIQKDPNDFVIMMARKYGDRILFSEDCIAKGTLIRTECDGYIPIEAVHPGMKVLTHLGNFKKVTATKGTFTSKSMISLNLRGNANLICTSDHKIYVRESRYSPNGDLLQNFHESTPSWIEAGKIIPGSWVYLPYPPQIAKLDYQDVRIDLSEYGNHGISRNLRILPNNIKNHSSNGKATDIRRFFDMGRNECFFIGLFLGDGNAYNNLTGFAIHGNEWARIEACFLKIAKKYRIPYDMKVTNAKKPGEKWHSFRFINSHLSKFLRVNCYGSDKEKIMPHFYNKLSLQQRLWITEGILWADGTDRNGNGDGGVSLSMSSLDVISKVRELMLSLKVYASYSSRMTNGATKLTHTVDISPEGLQYLSNLWKKKVAERKRQCFSTDGSGFWLRVNNTETVGGEGAVYDLTVEDDHSFCTPYFTVHNCHVATEKDKQIQDVRLSNGTEAWKFYNAYSMESTDFWAEKFQRKYGFSDRDVEEMVDNSYHFIDHFKDYKFHTAKDGWFLPSVKTIFGDKYEGRSNKEILKELIRKSDRMPPKDHPRYQEYLERLKYEVSVIADNGKIDLLPYFFTVADIADWCRDNDVLMNLRGSGGGSLLAYLLGLSITDSVKWNLPFERCLTVDRILAGTLPDLDCDFSSKSKVLEYLRTKYNNNTAPISINSLIKVKAAIRDVERMEKGEVTIETEMMCRALPNIPQGVESLKWLNGYMDKETEAWVQGFLEDPSDAAKKLKEYSINEPVIWQTVTRCLGIMRQKSQHACASVITDQEVTSLVPLAMIGDELITGFCPKSCEYVGLVKFDFLGVQTLESIRLSLAEIKKDTGLTFPWGEFPAEVKDYESIIRPMQTAGLFQIKTHTMRPFVQNTQPRDTGDLSNLVALVRPGAMDAPAPDGSEMSAAEYFIAVRQGKTKPYYIHPDLEPILGETYGIILFQEQTLQIFRDLAGYTYGTAEGVRRAIGKKVKEEMELHLGVLEIKLAERGWSERQTTTLVDSILASSRYSFNKSHSCSYGIVTNNGIFLKSRYPLYFYLGELQSNIDDRDKARDIMAECRSIILPPDILTSHPTEWRIEQTEKLRAPLSIVKGVGGKAASSISLIMQNGIAGLALKPPPVKKEKAPTKPTKKSLKSKELSLS